MRLNPISESSIFEDLRDPDFAAKYLEEILKDGSLDLFLIAVRDVVRANSGFSKASQKAGIGRESLYKTLSKNGNPRFSTLQSLLEGVGLRFSVCSNPSRRKKRAA